MTALILVVDDILANVKLLEAKLNNEYYDVITANNGFKAIEQAKEHKPDIILLDVMMPEMDGFEACRKMKEDPEISHIPIVMVTALSDKQDRINGLEAGADDFITKPINDVALFARVKSLIRIKVLLDELRMRDKTGAEMGIMNEGENSFISNVDGSNILIIDDDVVQSSRLKAKLDINYNVKLIEDHNEINDFLDNNKDLIDLVIVSTQLSDADGLRLASHMRNIDEMRHVPIIMLVDEDDTHIMLKGLEIGINDYLVVPMDYNEMFARVKTQIRRKKYQDALKSNYRESLSMAITDKLTGLYNRHYLDTHMQNLIGQAFANKKTLSVAILDMDHFKLVNDNYGHDAGDEVLQQLSKVIVDSVRGSDLVARMGGEEFVVLMPETEFNEAHALCDRIRFSIEKAEFNINHEINIIQKTVSIGVASLDVKSSTDNAADMVKRADIALFDAKDSGRNKVMPDISSKKLKIDTGF